MFGPSQAASPPVLPPMDHTAVGTDFDPGSAPNLPCRHGGSKTCPQRGQTHWTGANSRKLSRTGGMRIVPSLRSGVLWAVVHVSAGNPGSRLEDHPSHWSGFTAPSRVLGASSEEVGLQLAFLAFELFDFLLYRGDALQGLAMAALPVFGLLAEAEVLTLQSLYFSSRSSATSRPGLAIRSAKDALG